MTGTRMKILTTLLLSLIFAIEPLSVLAVNNCEVDIKNPNKHVDLSNLPDSCDDAETNDSETILATLPNGKSKLFKLKQGRSSSGSFRGEDDADGSSFQFIRKKDSKVFGSIVDATDNTVTQFSVDADGNQVVKVTHTNDFPPEDDPDDEEPSSRYLRGDKASRLGQQALDFAASSSTSRQLNTGDDGSFLDVMVVWTADAECKESGLSVGCTRTETTEDNMRALIDLAVAETNTAFETSGVITRLRLVHATYIEYTESVYVAGQVNPFADALNEITSTSDGIMDEVHDLRTQYGADIVAMIIGATSSCGRAWMGPSPTYMFSVTSYNCATGYYSFGHEIGHNLGCKHDRGTSNECTSTDYNFAYRAPDASFRTILGYNCVNTKCDNNAGGGCTRIQRFSTPDVTYNNQALGTSGSDNVRQINDVSEDVALFYTHVETPSPTPATTPAPSSPSGSNGDPHFKTWKNEHFEYHGQCDMVLAKDDSFADGIGLDVQIRTKVVRYWSYIKTAAIRIGEDILEVEGGPESATWWFNNERHIESHTEVETIGGMLEVKSEWKGVLGGFPVTHKLKSGWKQIFEIDLSSKYPGQKIILSTYKEFVRVDFENGSEESFGNTKGLLGDFTTGRTLARDGLTVMNDFWEYGNEWQVRPFEFMLFHESSEPQFPERCILPESPRGDRRRHLEELTVTETQAEAACSHLKDPLDRKDCVYDIVATQDLGMVGAY